MGFLLKDSVKKKFKKHSLTGKVSDLGARTWDWRCLGHAPVKAGGGTGQQYAGVWREEQMQ